MPTGTVVDAAERLVPARQGDQLARNHRVLVVDDSPPCRAALCELLERRGYEIVGEAGGAAAAMELVELISPDAVLLDVRLPDGDGFEVAAQLRQRHPHLPVLLTSSDFGPGFHARADASGARGFVPKDQLAEAQLELFWSRAEA